MSDHAMILAEPSATQMQPARVSLIGTMASRYGMDPAAFQATIRATVMPAGATNEQMAAFLLVANTYGLNPITREIYAFPARGGGITPVVGVDGYINLAQRRAEFDGVEFEFADDAAGKCLSCTCRVWRKDRSRPVEVTEYMSECARATDPWKSHPRRMLRHKALIQALRLAFGFAGIHDEDDAEVIAAPALAARSSAADLTARLVATSEPPAPAPEPPAWPRSDPETGELVDARGCPWLAEAHSANKTCTETGEWRRKRGVDPERVEAWEQEAMHRAATPDEQPTPEPAADDAEEII